MVSEEQLTSMGDSVAGVLSAGNYSADHPSRINDRFKAAFRATKGPADPDFLAVSVYDSIDTIYKLAEAQHGSLDPDKSMQLLRTMHLDSPRGDVSFDPETRDVVQTMYIRRTEKRGDKLVIFSDGLTEAENPEGAFFDTERLRVCLRDHASSDAIAMHTALRTAVDRFAEGGAMRDDVTALVIEYSPG